MTVLELSSTTICVKKIWTFGKVCWKFPTLTFTSALKPLNPMSPLLEVKVKPRRLQTKLSLSASGFGFRVVPVVWPATILRIVSFITGIEVDPAVWLLLLVLQLFSMSLTMDEALHVMELSVVSRTSHKPLPTCTLISLVFSHVGMFLPCQNNVITLTYL